MVEINKTNLGQFARFSANGGAEKIDPIEFGKDVKPQDFVKAIQTSVAEKISVRGDVFEAALDQLPFTSHQAKIIVGACNEGLVRVGRKEADTYQVKHPEMNQYRRVRRKAITVFDSQLNKLV